MYFHKINDGTFLLKEDINGVSTIKMNFEKIYVSVFLLLFINGKRLQET
jgi:hypothetical protein